MRTALLWVLLLSFLTIAPILSQTFFYWVTRSPIVNIIYALIFIFCIIKVRRHLFALFRNHWGLGAPLGSILSLALALLFPVVLSLLTAWLTLRN